MYHSKIDGWSGDVFSISTGHLQCSFSFCSSSSNSLYISVPIGPNAIPFTRIPLVPNFCSYIFRYHLHLDLGCSEMGRISCTEYRFMIQQLFRVPVLLVLLSIFWSIYLNASLLQRNARFKLTSMTWFQLLADISFITLETPLIMVLLTNISRLPNFFTASSINDMQTLSCDISPRT